MGFDKRKNIVLRTKSALETGGNKMAEKVNVNEVLVRAMRLPLVNIDRAKFLQKELRGRCSEKQLIEAVSHNPAYAGISVETIDSIAKQIFANGVSKVIPIVGGVVTGTLTYFTFKPSAQRLQKSFQLLNLCDPEYYKNPGNFPDYDIVFTDDDFRN